MRQASVIVWAIAFGLFASLIFQYGNPGLVADSELSLHK
jgi:hypothetical protein